MKQLVVVWVAAAALALAGCSSDQDSSPPVGSAGSSAGSAGSAQGGATAGQGGNASGGSGVAGAAVGGSSAGSVGTAGSGGTAGNSGGSAGAAGSGGSPAVKSAGCGTGTAATGAWTEQTKLAVNGKDRQWWVWLPAKYDANRAYPVVFTFHGCGGPTGFLPMEKVTGEDAIVVRGSGGDNGCWAYAGDGDDVKFFDAMLSTVEQNRCVDTSRIFLTGYSSGSWFSNTLDCARGDKIRGTATVSGGVVGDRGTCKGEYARLFIHDTEDPTNFFDDWTDPKGVTHKGQGNKQEVARIAALNHCMADAALVPEDPAPCARYQGCDAGFPLVVCRTMGKGHDRQDALATNAFWKFFKSL